MGRDLRIKAQELALAIVERAPLEYQFGDPATDALDYVHALEAEVARLRKVERLAATAHNDGKARA